ncbi:MAG: MFS transporter [bacterium]|nr:MFS transporter [bacterium]
MPDEKQAPRDPRWALSLFYAAGFGHLGIVMPFMAPWIRDRGYSATLIGLLLALPPLFKILAPWTWGAWADRTGRRRPMLVVALTISSAALAAASRAPGPVALFALMALYGFTRAPMLPFAEATTLEQAERHGFAYGPIRLWGSMAFIAGAGLFGLYGVSLGVDAAPLAGAAMLLAAAGIAWVALPEPVSNHDVVEKPALDAPVGRAGVARFLAACALMQASHGAYYTFYSIRLQELGYGSGTIGALWALAVICEVLLLVKMDSIVERFGNRPVLRLTLVLAAARWLLIGSVVDLPWLIAGQVLHAATYAAFHVPAVRVVYRHFGSTARARGQAIYSGMTFGLGMFVGTLVAGRAADTIGLPLLFQLSALPALAAIPLLGRSRARQS